jgi:hypothetical protein
MKACLSARHVAAAAAGGIFAALSFSGIAQAITDTVFKYTVPKTGYYSIDRTAMYPGSTNSGADYQVGTSTPGLGLITGQNACFQTGVHLPHGATVTLVRIWHRFSGATGNPHIRLRSQMLADGIPIDIASREFTSNVVTRTATNLVLTPGHTKIDNFARAYGLIVCIYPDDIFFAARITYTYENAGD